MKTPDEFAQLMGDRDSNLSDGGVVSFDFVKPPGLFVLPPLVCAFLFFIAYLGFGAGDQSAFFVLAPGFAALMPFMMINSWLSTSDMLVDDRGISRVLFGKTWCRLAWSNVKFLQSREGVQLRTGRTVQEIVIYPKVKARFRQFPSGKMMLPQAVVGQERLIEVMNRYVVTNRIPVQKISAGIKTDASML